MSDDRRAGVEDLLAELTLEEKLDLVRGRPDPEGRATGYLPGVDRVGVPPLRMVDGPLGVRAGTATAFPSTIALGASWDVDLARRMGEALASEARAKNQDVLLGPGVNLVRVPTSGRNFEYIAEDPHLSGEIGAGYVQGLEAAGVGATPKHYVANNQETHRNTVDVDVTERALRECYLRPFERTVEADASVVMAAYNRVGGDYMTEHDRLLRDVLKGEWGFPGLVVSDWWATHDTTAAATAGLDVEMPGVGVLRWLAPSSRMLQFVHAVDLSGRLRIDPPIIQRIFDRFMAVSGQPDPFDTGVFGDPLRSAVEDGEVPESTVDEAVRRVLTVYDRLGMLSGERPPMPTDAVGHRDLARELAVLGTVILKNDGVLPLDGESVAVIGPNADEAKVGGGGSSSVHPAGTVSTLEGLDEHAAGGVTFERGVPAIHDPGLIPWPWERPLLPRLRSPSMSAAVDAAAEADVAVVVVQDAATEGADRRSMGFPGRQDSLVAAVAEANDRTVVVSQTSGPVEMPWADDVAAVVQHWYPGQEDGHALADVLYGTDPGGRLPVTFGEAFEDYPVATERRYPGIDGTVHYEEGIFVGYRHFDDADVEPRFPFGHGESYAEFNYEDCTVDVHFDATRFQDANGDVAVVDVTDDPAVTVTVTLTNTADRPGREVVQCYLDAPSGPVPRPAQALAGFAPVALEGGDTTTVEVAVPERALARYDESAGGWVVDGGTYRLRIGHSSRDIRTRSTFEV